jgi:dolichol-phosphate mannosyltransferase
LSDARSLQRVLVVLPSFNESENIVEITQAVLDLTPGARVCIVDDSSPDGTARIVATAIRDRPGWGDRVDLLVRSGKEGRGSAVRAGFAAGDASGRPYDAYVEMDCDFSHEPGAIAQGLELLGQGNDVVIGARYPDGVIINWPLGRRVFSFAANLLARVLIDWSVPDYTNGFRFYSPPAMRVLLAHQQRHKGYIYLSESLSHLLRAKLRVAVFPITFKNRVRGASNTTLREISAALRGILAVTWHHRFGRE